MSRVITVRFLLLVFATMGWRVMCLSADESLSNEEKPIFKNYLAGETAKMMYKPRTRDLIPVTLKYGHWTRNKLVIMPDDYFVIRNNTEKGRFCLKIKKVDSRNSGLYSFVVNGTVVKQWKLQVTKAFLHGDQGELPCGKPMSQLVSTCMSFSEKIYPNCRSFPGPPLKLQVFSYHYKGNPAVQVTWKAPNTGRSDLWGYQVYIVGKDDHPGHIRCRQINNKTAHLYWIFHENIKYGATYHVTVMSMPAALYNSFYKNTVSTDIRIPEKCQFSDNMNLSECCSLINITAEYSDKKIHLSWAVALQKQCREINIFKIIWVNHQKPKHCSGIKFIEGNYSYTINLEKEDLEGEECSRFKYTIRLSGQIKRTESKISKVTVLIPSPTQPSHGPIPADCFDKWPICGYWAVRGDCKRKPGYMKANCCVWCNHIAYLQQRFAHSACSNRSHRCVHRANLGDCCKNPAYMLDYCCAACKDKGYTVPSP